MTHTMKRTTTLLLLIMAALSLHAQELTVKSFSVAQGDLSASTQPRNDRNGDPCGLIKVQLASPGAVFEGNILGNTDFKTGEYWVYMSKGSYMLQVKHPSCLPLAVNFRDYGIRGVEPKTTYTLTLLLPQAGEKTGQLQKLIINYTPANAMVVIDGKSYSGNGHVETEPLPLGEHRYMIVAQGYIASEGTVGIKIAI